MGFAIRNRLIGDTLDLHADAIQVDLGSGRTRIIFGSAWHPRSEMDSPGGLVPHFTSYRLISAVTSDGINWTRDPGARTSATDWPSPDTCYGMPGKAIKRPDGTQLIYMSCGAFLTTDGLELTRIKSGQYLKWGPLEPDALDQHSSAEMTIVGLPDGRYRMYKAIFYGATLERGAATVKIFSYISDDGFTFTKEPGVRIPEFLQWDGDAKDGFPRFPRLPCKLKNYGHPIVHQASDGTWIMVFKNAGCTYNGPPLPTPGPGISHPTPAPGAPGTEGIKAKFSVATSKNGLDWTLTDLAEFDDGINTSAEPYAVLPAPEGGIIVVYSCLEFLYATNLDKLLHSGLCLVRRTGP